LAKKRHSENPSLLFIVVLGVSIMTEATNSAPWINYNDGELNHVY